MRVVQVTAAKRVACSVPGQIEDISCVDTLDLVWHETTQACVERKRLGAVVGREERESFDRRAGQCPAL